MSHPPPLPPLRRNISRSLENISEVAGKYEKKMAPPGIRPPKPVRPLAEKKLPPTPQPEPEYEVIKTKRKTDYDTASISSTKFNFKSYDLHTFCKEMKLPKAVEVTDGFCGPTDDIPVGYQLMLYFQKTTRVVRAKDILDIVYDIPLNSSLQFAPIDDLHLKPKAGSLSGFYYDSIEEMLQERHSLPKVVCAKGNFTKGRYSVNPHDVLFPKKVDKTTLGNKVIGLHCTKISGEEIKLPLDCACGFSTATNDTRLYLPEYVEYVNQFPVKVYVYGMDNSVLQGDMPMTLILQGEHMLRSLVARSLHCDTETITEISMDVPIKIRCLQVHDEVSEQERVRKVYETFSTSKVTSTYYVTKTQAQYQAQKQLYAKVRQEHDAKYYEIVSPDSIIGADTLRSKSSNDTLSDAAQSSPKPSRHRIFKTNLLKHRSHSVGDDDSLDNSDTSNPVWKHKLRSLLPGKHKVQGPGDDGSEEVDTNAQSLNLKEEFETLAESLKAEMKAEIKQELESSLHEEIRKLRVDNAHCLQQLARVNETIQQLQKQTKGTSSPPVKPKPSNKPTMPGKPPLSQASRNSGSFEDVYKSTPQENKKFLQSLSHLKVLQLLDGMKLEKYKSEFKQSFVDGQLLATLSQIELAELKVNSSLHQRKLLNIIEGKESAQKYLLLAQEDPYTMK